MIVKESMLLLELLVFHEETVKTWGKSQVNRLPPACVWLFQCHFPSPLCWSTSLFRERINLETTGGAFRSVLFEKLA